MSITLSVFASEWHFIVTHEISELQSPLDFLKEHLNRPTCFIQITNGICHPFKVVANENHLFHVFQLDLMFKVFQF